MLFSIAYFPPISYFALIAKDFAIGPDGSVVSSLVFIDACEHYQKQSWRNRCQFYAADGPQYLNFPIIHENGTHELPITEIKVDYSTPWILRTERAIASAYEASPYFDYYKDELFAILESRPATLFELDLNLIRFFLKKIGICADIALTDHFVAPEFRSKFPGGVPASVVTTDAASHPVSVVTTDAASPVSANNLNSTVSVAGEYGEDYREVIHPKRKDTILQNLGLEKPYFQVFAQKHGFISNLSIMDLLFNEGPDSLSFLKSL